MKITTEEKAMRMLNPVHPGRFPRTGIIDAHCLSITEAAKLLRVSRPALSSLWNAKADLSGGMALRFEKAFGVDMDTLMRMRNSCDIARTRSRAKKIQVRRYQPRPVAWQRRPQPNVKIVKLSPRTKPPIHRAGLSSY